MKSTTKASPSKDPRKADRPIHSATRAKKASDKPAAPADAGKTRYYMRRPGSYGGQAYDRDQVIDLGGQQNDERIVRLGYVAVLDMKPVTCNECPGLFRTAGARDAHAKKRHHPEPRRKAEMAPRQPGESTFDYDRRASAFRQSVIEQEAAEEQREERELERAAPINWDKTEATRNAEL